MATAFSAQTVVLTPVPALSTSSKTVVLAVSSTFNPQSDTKFVQLSQRANEGG